MRGSSKELKGEMNASDIENHMESSEFHHDNEADHFLCDWCSKGVSIASEPRVSHYMADSVLDTGHRECKMINSNNVLTQLATYCEECSSKRLLFPCEGFSEIRVQFTIKEDPIMRDVEVTDISPDDDGIPWDPVSLTERVTQRDFQSNALLTGHLYAPENIVTAFLSWLDNVDIRSMIQPDGQIRPKKLGQARREFRDFKKSMVKDGYSRSGFSSYVRDKR
jgi:hypothetical protein